MTKRNGECGEKRKGREARAEIAPRTILSAAHPVVGGIIEVKVAEIVVGERFRKDIGDLDRLAATIEEAELLQPIGITPDYRLVFGLRRLLAYRDVLGRETILARIVPIESILLGEIAENIMRKDYTPSELVAIVQTIRSFSHGGDRRSNQARSCGVEATTTEEAVRLFGWSKDTFARAQKVVEKGIPELRDAMDRREISISAAAILADGDPEGQRACIAKPVDGEKLVGRRIKRRLQHLQRAKEIAATEERLVLLPRPVDAIRLFHCPFQQLEQMAGIEPESVQMICTDIPYGKDFLPQVSELADFAGRVLVPGGVLTVLCGQYWLPEVMSALARILRYRWAMASVWEGDATVVHFRGEEGLRDRITSLWKPILIFSKGEWKSHGPWTDLSQLTGKEKQWHGWGQPLPEVEMLVRTFSRRGDLVIDPCGGGFTTAIACNRLGRRCISCDCEKENVLKGQERLALEAAATQAA